MRHRESGQFLFGDRADQCFNKLGKNQHVYPSIHVECRFFFFLEREHLFNFTYIGKIQ